MFVSVVIRNSTREYDKFYDYRIPIEMEEIMQPGIRVIVPFGKGEKLREAFVMEIKTKCHYKNPKEISQVIDEEPVLTSDLIKLSHYMKRRYICTYDQAIRCMLPTGLSLSFSHELVLIPGSSTAITDEEKEIIDIIVDNDGKIGIEKVREKTKKPVGKTVAALEKKKMVKKVNRFQIKVKSKTMRVAYPIIESDEFQELVQNKKIRSLKYIRIMELLFDEGDIPVNELNMMGFSSAVLKNMEKKGFLSFYEEVVDRNPLEMVDAPITEPPVSTPCQKKALQVIEPKIASETFQEILLHGITGSGKTEVYMQVIAKVLEKGQGAIMLVPEIGLTPQTVRRFKGRFQDNVAVLHSRLSMGERFDQWNRIRKGEIKVVIGARSAVFAPLEKIGTIIIDEEHETSYKSDRTPKYDARTIAAARCRSHQGLVLYGSATPSVENYQRAKIGRIALVEMHERTNALPLPEIVLVDMRREMDRGVRNECSNQLINALRRNKEAGEQSILFINRRGHSHFILCKNCGFIPMCPYCSVSLTWHRVEDRLVCHYCSYATALPEKCPVCKNESLAPLGVGTQKVEEMISGIEPGFSVIRMDFDTTGGKRGHQRILDAFQNKKIDVLVGTQMVAKGHDFPGVTLVGIMSADSLLGSGDYRAGERTFQLITQAAGRAGRAGKHGRVIVQTYNLDDYSIQAAIRQDFPLFFRQEIKMRKELRLPPFYQFGVIHVSGRKKEKIQSISKKIHRELIAHIGTVTGLFLSDPAPSPVSKIKNQYRWRIVIKHPSIRTLGTILEWVYDTYHGGGEKEWTVSVDINPVSML